MEACGGAHHWARQLTQFGHSVRLIPPAYVKPFVKRQKNDVVDAEAICEAAQRPGMRFVAVKAEEQQASGMVFRTRDLMVRQRTQLTNALRGHLAEYGWVAPKGAIAAARAALATMQPAKVGFAQGKGYANINNGE
jgi:transposase